MPKPKPKMYLGNKIKWRRKALISAVKCVVTWTEFEKEIPWKSQSKVQNRFNIFYKYLQIKLNAHTPFKGQGYSKADW